MQHFGGKSPVTYALYLSAPNRIFSPSYFNFRLFSQLEIICSYSNRLTYSRGSKLDGTLGNDKSSLRHQLIFILQISHVILGRLSLSNSITSKNAWQQNIIYERKSLILSTDSLDEIFQKKLSLV